jgi:hypothetical protein
MVSPNPGIGKSVFIITGIVVWEEEEDDYWDGLPLDWAMDGDFGEEAMAIRDVMEEEFQLIERQKSKGKKRASEFA